MRIKYIYYNIKVSFALRLLKKFLKVLNMNPIYIIIKNFYKKHSFYKEYYNNI